MDFFNRGFAQIVDVFRSMTPGARIIAALLLVAITVSIGYLFQHPLAGADAYLFGGDPVPSGQLPGMEAAFAKGNLSAYQIEGGRIRVPRGQQAFYMAALAEAQALPVDNGGFLRAAIDKGGLLGTTRAKADDMRRVALQDELALVIRSMHGIEKASVLIDSQVEPGLTGKKVATAAVSVKPQGNAALEEDRVPMIQRFVAAAFSGLSPDSVAIADLNTGRTYFSDGAGGMGGGMNQYGAVKREFERNWEEKIRSALSYIPGAIVKANVDLDLELDHSEVKTTYDSKTVPIERTEITSTSSSTPGGTGGRPGVVPQGGINQPAAVSNASFAGNRTEEEKSNTHDVMLPPTTVTHSRKASLTPQRATVTVSIPSTYLEKLWQERNPPAAGQEPKKPDKAALDLVEAEVGKKVQSLVSALLPNKDPKDPRPNVTVTAFQQLPSEAIPGPSLADHALSWVGDYWRSVATGLLGLVGLSMLRSMVRSAGNGLPSSASLGAASTGTAAAATEELEEAGTPTEGDQPPAPRRRRRIKAGPSSRDELVEIVREDPDAAANILRTWIGSGT